MTLNLANYGWIPREKRYDHPERRRMRLSPARFKWCAGGRRSGKTSDGIEYITFGHGPLDARGLPLHRGCLTVDDRVDDPTFVVAGPTFDMLRRIWWDKLKRGIPRSLLDGRPNERMIMRFKNGSRLMLLGMDKPTHAEGIPIDGLVFDEYAYSKPGAYRRSLRPALSTAGRPPGWGILMGKPHGRNHFYRGWKTARERLLANHEAFHWKSSVVISEVELAQARLDMDPQEFREQYEASFESYTGLAYYCFGDHNYASKEWDPNYPLAFAFDFGTSPGTVVVAQMLHVSATHCYFCGHPKPATSEPNTSWGCALCKEVAYAQMPVLFVIDEVYRLVNARTRMLCEELVTKWASRVRPQTPVHLYGDPAGFSKNTHSVSSDWDEIQQILGRHFNVKMHVRKAQPPQRDRVNALLRIVQADCGLVRLFVDKDKAPHTWEDFENTVLKQDGSGEIDKKAAGGLYSHLTDALGYLALEEFPRHNRGIDSEVVGT